VEQTAEFVGVGGQTTEVDAADGCRVVDHDGHGDLHPYAMLAL
jgi:hypothetical protein